MFSQQVLRGYCQPYYFRIYSCGFSYCTIRVFTGNDDSRAPFGLSSVSYEKALHEGRCQGLCRYARNSNVSSFSKFGDYTDETLRA